MYNSKPEWPAHYRMAASAVSAIAAGAVTGFLIIDPVSAADQAAAPLVSQIRNCARIENRDNRLDCYDGVSRSLDKSAMPDTSATPQPARAEESIEDSIGKREGRSLFGNKTERPPDVAMMLIKAEKDNRRRWTFYFDNGQVWRQINSGYVLIPDGDAVPATLSHGVLGSFDLRLADSKRKVKVKRIK